MIPALAEYLSRHVTECRGESFEEFQNLTSRILAMKGDGALSPQEAAQLRWLKVISVAMVETINSEILRGEDYLETLTRAARTIGYLTFDLVISHASTAAPKMPLVKMLTAEFREGAKQAALALERNVEAAAPSSRETRGNASATKLRRFRR